MTDVVRVIDADEDIWAPTSEEIEKKGKLLSIEDQRGTIQLELTDTLDLTDGASVDHLLVRAPRQKQVQAYQSGAENNPKQETQFYGGCCLSIKPGDVANLHSRDWTRLTRIVTSFIV